ncbi:MAG: porin [Bradyrhizobium sp.]|uniref:porin n=1 Tax=Bradyrhizobium sp. TaxID=376 RepID=UPI0025C6B977|nr:porin [Bradyrhizobium sp.]MBI5264289.1 porin [Bradyrhizobium sp.]
MKMIKSLVLGSAAGLIAMGGAQAADLPVKAKAVEYVKICSLYGAGFYYIPGTDTCIKLGGYLRVDAVVNGSGDYIRPNWDGAAGQHTRHRNYFLGRSREDLNIDTRTATELGVVRTFFDATFTWTSGDAIAGGTLGVYYAFIQFAGFTMGKAISQFDVPWTNYPANFNDFLVGGSGDVTGVNQLSYTADFGSGITASISLQDPTNYYYTALYNTSGGTATTAAGGAYGTNSYGGAAAPDVVGQLRVDQAWGLFQASIAAHDNHTSYYTTTNETSGHPSDKWGWAGQLGLSIKNIPTGPGDTINLQAAYSNGASRYVFQSLVPISYAMYGSTGLAGAYQSVAFAGVSDAVFAGTSAATGTGLELTSAWGFRGGYTHNWDAKWFSSIFGAYAALSYNTNGKALVCATYSASMVAGSTCNPDFNIWQIGTRTGWTPVKGLTISGEVTYTALDQKNTGAITLPAISAKPAAVYEFKDQGTWTGGFRVQRNW